MAAMDFKTVLVIGASSGIGQALAETLSGRGKKVIIAARRKDRMDSISEANGGMLKVYTVDLSKLDTLKGFCDTVINENPDLDAVIFNSGVQAVFDFSNPESVDLEALDTETLINYTSYMHLTKYLAPHFIQQASKGAAANMIYVTSGLAFVPMPNVLNYCASKAALHHFCMCLREQLKPKGVRVTELIPPLVVDTELHDGQQGWRFGKTSAPPFALMLSDYIKETMEGLEANLDEIPAGPAKIPYNAVETGRKKVFGWPLKPIASD